MTTNLLSGFDQFKMSEAQCLSLGRDFEHHFFRMDLSPAEPGSSHPGQKQFDRIDSYHTVPGIYFWIMRYGDSDDLFSIYVGKTKSLSYRVRNYRSEFQPHSPNDFKLRIFQSFLSDHAPAAVLDMLFAPKNVDQLTLAENAAISTYRPLLNTRRAANASARKGLQSAFEQFYRSAFQGLLQGDSN